jgi:hypothetical protein
VREHYIDRFESFIDRQEEGCVRGHAEVMFEIPGSPDLHRNLTRVDFVKNDNGVEAVFFEPEHVLSFEAFSAVLGAMAVEMESLRWDGVVVHHDLVGIPPLDMWFQRWFDPNDERRDSTARLAGFIHSLSISPACVSVDFGTAPANALLQLLERLEAAGARKITINDRIPTTN